jgi:hypothetical protein
MSNLGNNVPIHLTDAQIDEIAEKAAEKAVAKMTAHIYQEVGKGIINKLLWVIGVIVVGTYGFLSAKGIIK